MKDKFPMISLRSVLNEVERPEVPLSGQKYRQAGVRLWGEGVYERESIDGSETKYTKLYQLDFNDIVVNKIWARNGSVGVVPKQLSGCYVSSEFPTFTPIIQAIEPRWFHWITKTKWFWEQCAIQSHGTSGKNRIKPDKFLEIKIPLPQLEEQKRIVARIDELAGKIKEAQGLKNETSEVSQSLLTAEEMLIWPDSSLQSAPTLADVTSYLARGRQSKQGDSAHYLIKTQHVQMGKYLKSNATLDAGVAMKVLPQAMAKHGDVLIACSAAGCLGRVAFYTESVIQASTDTHVAIARANLNMILPQYLYAYLKGAQGQIQLRSRERGDWKRDKIGFRLTELNVNDMRRVPIPLPSIEEQKRILAYLDSLQSKVETLKHLQSETVTELEAFLPVILDRAFKGEL